MKRNHYSLFTAALMCLAVTSCSQEEDFRQSSNEMTTFNLLLESASQSRAAGEADEINTLYYEVYQDDIKVLDNNPTDDEKSNNDYIDSGSYTQKADGSFRVELPLLKGEKYFIVFWAQSSEADIYDPKNLKDIKVNYEEATANNEHYDAFFYNGNTTAQSATTEIKLTRPFAQLNIGTTEQDWKNAKAVIGDATILPVTHSAITATGLATTFNASTGVAAAPATEETVTFSATEINGETFNAKNEVYQNLSINYLLVPGVADSEGNIKTTINATATFYRGTAANDDTEIFSINNLSTLPIQRNYRTNILGDLLADNKNFDVDMDTEFDDGDQNITPFEKEVSTIEELQEALADPNVDVIELNQDLDLTPTSNGRAAIEEGILKLDRDITIKGNGKSLKTSAKRAILLTASNINVTIENMNIVSSAIRQNTEDIRGINIEAKDANGNFLKNVSLTLNQCSVDFTDSSACDWAYAVNVAGTDSEKHTINIIGGSYEGANVINVWGNNHKINIDGATLTSLYEYNDSYCGSCIALCGTGCDLTVRNTTYISTHAVTIYCPEGKDKHSIKCENNIDNTKLYVAQVGSTPYYTLAEAIASIETEGSVVMRNSITLEEIIQIEKEKNITLDLSGCDITGTDKTEKNFSLIDNRGTLVVKNSDNNATSKMTLTATTNSGWNRYSAVIANNPGGNLTIESNVFIEHLGGTDMAYGIDNLTNGKGTSAITTINGATVKSTYRAVRQFLNGIEATNDLTIKSGSKIEGTNNGIFFHDPSKNANTGKLIVEEGANVNGVYLFVTDGSTEWPVEVSIAASAIGEKGITNKNVPAGYAVINKEGTWIVSKAVSAETSEAISTAIENGNTHIALSGGEYSIPSTVEGKTIILEGAGENTVIDFTKINTINNASITFKNLKIKGKNENIMSGFGIQHTTGHIAYEDCILDGAVTHEYYGTVSYKNCTFTGTGYITTYAIKSATFEGCKFNKADSRAVLVYSHGDNPVEVTLTDCEFTAKAKGYTGAGDWTAAVEIDTTNIKTAGTKVTINKCSYDENYSSIYRDKSAATATKAVITVNN